MPWTFGPPLVRGKSGNAQNNILRTPMEQGEQRRQLVSIEKLLIVSEQWHLEDDAALTAFWNFYDSDECKQGAAFFSMPMRITGPLANHQVAINSVNTTPEGPRGTLLSLGLELKR